jgi:hypothetical protein
MQRSVAGEVWNRIESAEESRRASTIFARIELAFSRPAFAAAFVAACVLLGLFLAETRLSEHHKHRSALLEQSYLQMLDPRVETVDATATPASFQP